MAIIGIDLGTTNSLAAVWRDGRAELIPNGAGEYLTPSAVSIDEDGTVLVGQAARDRLITHPERSAAVFKRDMGTEKQFDLGGRKFTPEELSALVLRKLKEDAEAYLGELVAEAVVSVPAYFAEAARTATKRAGALAGLTVERLVNEPSAAAVAGRIGEGDEEKTCLVFDFGGGTLDVSLVERFDNVVSVTAVSGDNRLGGRDFDKAIAQGFCEDCGIDWDSLERAQRELLRQAEQCKIALTNQKNVLMVCALGEGEPASLTLTNEWLIRKGAPLFKRLTAPIRRVLADSGLRAESLDELVMVGGSSRMPSVRGYIAKTLGREPAAGARPDTAIALGAGICGGMKARAEGLRELVLTDVCPFTLGTNVANYADPGRPIFSPIIERNSVLPSSKMGTYCTSYDNQTNIDVGVFQGENLHCDENTQLGMLHISVPPAPRGRQLIRVRFTYDINGILEVEVLSEEDQKTDRLLIRSGGVSEEEAQKRMQELSQLKIAPREQEETKAILAKGGRLYASCVGELRERVLMMLGWFQEQLKSQEPLRIARAAKRTAAFFNQVERAIGELGFDGEEDSEDWWEEE